MATYNRSRQQSDATWKRLTHHISHISNTIQIDPEDSPLVIHRDSPETGDIPAINRLTLQFVVEARTRSGGVVGLLGNCAELGMWDVDHKVMLETEAGELPVWSTHEISFFVHSSHLSLEYKYLQVDSVLVTQTGVFSYEPRIENRKLEVKFAFTKSVRWVVHDKFGVCAAHVLDLRVKYPLFEQLKEDGNLGEWLPIICRHFELRAENVTLEDFLVLDYLFRYCSGSPPIPESKFSLEHCLRLTELLIHHSTWEIEPLIHSILRGLSRCSVSFNKLSRTVLDRTLVESARVPMGCHSQEVFEFLIDYMNFSPAPEQATARTVILNGVRRSLRKMRERSATPELLLIYDIYLEDVTGAYIEDNFVRGSDDNLLTEMHKITIILESLGLSGVCSEMTRGYISTLESVWHSNEMGSHLESLKGLLLDILAAHIDWLSRYSRVEGLAHLEDPLDLKSQLGDIGTRYTHFLFPTLSRALLKLDQEMRTPHYIPLKTGTAVGKVVMVDRLEEIPTAYNSVIAILSQRADSTKLCENVKAVLMLKEIEFDSKLVAYCQAKQILLAVVSERRIPANVTSCVQVHVFQDSLSFV